MTTLLALDCSSGAGSVALNQNERLVAEVFFDVRPSHSELLMGALREVLRLAGAQLADVDAFAVTLGPGSFTGLRVGIATVKGLAMARRKPVVGVSSLQTLAMNVSVSPLRVQALSDARKKEVYAGCYAMRQGWPVPLGEELVCAPARLLARVCEPTLFVGSGALAYAEEIERHLGELAHFAPGAANQPRAAMVALLAWQRLREQQTVSPCRLAPSYIRPSEAEIAWRQQNP